MVFHLSVVYKKFHRQKSIDNGPLSKVHTVQVYIYTITLIIKEILKTFICFIIMIIGVHHEFLHKCISCTLIAIPNYLKWIIIFLFETSYKSADCGSCQSIMNLNRTQTWVRISGKVRSAAMEWITPEIKNITAEIFFIVSSFKTLTSV